MNSTITKILETNIKGQLAGADIGGGICIAGSPGIGKSYIIRDIAEQFKLKVIDMRLSQCDPTDLNNFLIISK